MELVEFQALLLDNMRDAVIVWDLDGTITYWNSTAERLFGAKQEERIGKNVNDVFLSSFSPSVVPPDRPQDSNFREEHHFIFPDGEKIKVSSHLIPLHHQTTADARIGTMCISRGIDMLNGELELALFAQAARMASIGELASGIAHQISNPLTTIIADAQILTRDDTITPQNKVSAEAILQAGWRAQAVINELMSFSQPDQADREPASLNQTIDNALLMTSAYLQALGIKLKVNLANNLPEIVVNPRQITDLWVNLLLLERSAMKEQEDHQILIQTSIAKNGAVEICFTGDGSPISPEQLEQTFEPQLIPTGSGRGSGMELSICHEIVRQNNGRLYISTAGSQNSFHIIFNQKSDENTVEEIKVTALRKGSEPNPVG